MKKIGSIIISISLTIFLITGCSDDSSTISLESYNIYEAGTWKDGSYTEIAKGKKGNFDVIVTIKNGQISDIIISDNNETPNKGGVAIKTIPSKIIDTQSIDVDSISGATITSNGIKDAVAKCLEKASI